MGVYYTLVCHKAKEFIEPDALKGQGVKWGSIVHPKSQFGRLAIFAMLERWSGQDVKLVGEFYSCDYEDYKDVSLKVIADFNHDDTSGEKLEADPEYELQDSKSLDEQEARDEARAATSAQELYEASRSQLIETRLLFEQEIPAGATVEIDEHQGFVRTDGLWTYTERVGRFRAHHLEAQCRALVIRRIDIEDEEDETKKRNQFAQDTGIPVEVFASGVTGSGVQFEACFPELLSFTVSNPTNEPRLFKMVVSGKSIAV